MARPKGFAPDEALGHAMAAFWEFGYADTSTQVLMNVMHLGKRSLYDTFGDKHQLYLQALRQYVVRISAQQAQVVEASSGATARATIGALFDIRLNLGFAPLPGCFAVAAASDRGLSDGEVAQMVEAHFRDTEALIAGVLARVPGLGRSQREAVARIVHTAWLGYRVRLRSGMTEEEADRQMADILGLIPVS